MRDWDWRTVKITRELLLQRACPKCKQPKNEWCVFMPLVEWDGTVANVHSGPRVARQAKTGKPTVKCHNERYAVARDVLRRVWHHEKLKPVVPASEVTRASLRGIQEFERREREQLRAWLGEHAALLVFADRTT